MKAYDSLVVALGAYVAERHMRMFKICSRFFSHFLGLEKALGSGVPSMWERILVQKCPMVSLCVDSLSCQFGCQPWTENAPSGFFSVDARCSRQAI
jgi:hypothetical protein